MKYRVIRGYNLINDVDAEKVNGLVNSILANGWVGCPILIYGYSLLTGSHRLAALKKIEQMVWDGLDFDIDNLECAADVTEIADCNYAKLEAECGEAPDIDYANIGWLLAGSWVEDYKDEIEEW